MRLGYNTNGLTGHRWDQALQLLHETGYQSVALTIDHHCLNPYGAGQAADVARMQRLLERYGMISCIETGARFLLDFRHKHEPTLISPEPKQRAQRVDFLKRCVDLARTLGSEAVSFWSGVVRDGSDRETAMARLVEGVRQVLDYAAAQGVRLAFEPEPGMLVQTFEDYQQLLDHVDGPGFGLCVDIGHVHCLEDDSIADCLQRWSDRIYTIHIEDMPRGVHEHLRFGEGTIDFPPVMNQLLRQGYTGGINVELSRHSHAAPEVVKDSHEFLTRLIRQSSGGK